VARLAGIDPRHYVDRPTDTRLIVPGPWQETPAVGMVCEGLAETGDRNADGGMPSASA